MIHLDESEFEKVRRDMAAAIYVLWDEGPPFRDGQTIEEYARDCADVAFDALLDFDHLRGR